MPDPEPRAVPTSGDLAAPGSPGAVSFGLSRQMEIYQAGLSGRKPELPLTAEELELKARGVLPPEAQVLMGRFGSASIRVTSYDEAN